MSRTLLACIPILAISLASCGGSVQGMSAMPTSPTHTLHLRLASASSGLLAQATLPDTTHRKREDAMATKISITFGNHTLTATLEDNATTRALLQRLPLTITMQDLYARELCYHFPDALPTERLRSDGYAVGDLIYWPPRHSFVILYKQNGERFSRQHLGHIDSGVEIFDGMGDISVTFALQEK